MLIVPGELRRVVSNLPNGMHLYAYREAAHSGRILNQPALLGLDTIVLVVDAAPSQECCIIVGQQRLYVFQRYLELYSAVIC